MPDNGKLPLLRDFLNRKLVLVGATTNLRADRVCFSTDCLMLLVDDVVGFLCLLGFRFRLSRPLSQIRAQSVIDQRKNNEIQVGSGPPCTRRPPVTLMSTPEAPPPDFPIKSGRGGRVG